MRYLFLCYFSYFICKFLRALFHWRFLKLTFTFILLCFHLMIKGWISYSIFKNKWFVIHEGSVHILIPKSTTANSFPKYLFSLSLRSCIFLQYLVSWFQIKTKSYYLPIGLIVLSCVAQTFTCCPVIFNSNYFYILALLFSFCIICNIIHNMQAVKI